MPQNMPEITDREHNKYDDLYPSIIRTTTRAGEPCKVTVEEYDEDACYGPEYQAYWHPVNFNDFEGE